MRAQAGLDAMGTTQQTYFFSFAMPTYQPRAGRKVPSNLSLSIVVFSPSPYPTPHIPLSRPSLSRSTHPLIVTTSPGMD